MRPLDAQDIFELDFGADQIIERAWQPWSIPA